MELPTVPVAGNGLAASEILGVSESVTKGGTTDYIKRMWGCISNKKFWKSIHKPILEKSYNTIDELKPTVVKRIF